MANLQTAEMYAKTFNPKAEVVCSDPRCGRRFAVVTKDKEGRPTFWTQFLSLDALEEVLRMLINYKSFIKIKKV